jgi:hypothetical protein
LVFDSQYIVPDQFSGAFLPITQVFVPVLLMPSGVSLASLTLTYFGRFSHTNRNWAKNNERSPPNAKGSHPAKVVHFPDL